MSRLSSLFALLLLLSFSVSSLALDAVDFEYGTAEGDDEVDRYGVAFKWDWNKQWFTAGDWFLTGHWEAGITYWDGEDGRTGNDSFVDFGLTPVLRYQRKPGSGGLVPFAELGLGAHFHTDSEIEDKDFDVPFAFGSHFGVGARFGANEQFEFVYRFQHLSNASIGDKNPGINFHVLHLGYRF